MATLEAYRSKFRLLSKQEIIAERRELFQKTDRRQGNIQTYDVLFGEWLCTAPDIAMDNSLPKLATNEGRKTGATIGFYS